MSSRSPLSTALLAGGGNDVVVVVDMEGTGIDDIAAEDDKG